MFKKFCARCGNEISGTCQRKIHAFTEKGELLELTHVCGSCFAKFTALIDGYKEEKEND